MKQIFKKHIQMLLLFRSWRTPNIWMMTKLGKWTEQKSTTQHTTQHTHEQWLNDPSHNHNGTNRSTYFSSKKKKQTHTQTHKWINHERAKKTDPQTHTAHPQPQHHKQTTTHRQLHTTNTLTQTHRLAWNTHTHISQHTQTHLPTHTHLWTHTQTWSKTLTSHRHVTRNTPTRTQYRFELPPEFLLTLPCSGIVHHLLGPDTGALSFNTLKITGGCRSTYPSVRLRSEINQTHTTTHERHTNDTRTTHERHTNDTRTTHERHTNDTNNTHAHSQTQTETNTHTDTDGQAQTHARTHRDTDTQPETHTGTHRAPTDSACELLFASRSWRNSWWKYRRSSPFPRCSGLWSRTWTFQFRMVVCAVYKVFSQSGTHFWAECGADRWFSWVWWRPSRFLPRQKMDSNITTKSFEIRNHENEDRRWPGPGREISRCTTRPRSGRISLPRRQAPCTIRWTLMTCLPLEAPGLTGSGRSGRRSGFSGTPWNRSSSHQCSMFLCRWWKNSCWSMLSRHTISMSPAHPRRELMWITGSMATMSGFASPLCVSPFGSSCCQTTFSGTRRGKGTDDSTVAGVVVWLLFLVAWGERGAGEYLSGPHSYPDDHGSLW